MTDFEWGAIHLLKGFTCILLSARENELVFSAMWFGRGSPAPVGGTQRRVVPASLPVWEGNVIILVTSVMTPRSLELLKSTFFVTLYYN